MLVFYSVSVFPPFSKISRDKKLFKLRDDFAASLKDKGWCLKVYISRFRITFSLLCRNCFPFLPDKSILLEHCKEMYGNAHTRQQDQVWLLYCNNIQMK